MANKKNDTKKKTTNSESPKLSMFDKAAQNIFSILDSSYSDKTILNAKDQKIRSILNRELEISKGVSQGSIVDFVASMQIKNNNQKTNVGGMNNTPNTNELFTQNINDIFGHFQEMYKNRFIELNDLKFISKFIPSLGEAVKTILDAVVASDNVAETVNRSIELPSSVSEEDLIAITNEIKRNEKELGLLKKLKNVVYKKSLVTGTYYVYVVSYNKIFEEYDKKKKFSEKSNAPTLATQFGNGKRISNESFVLGDVDISDAMENVRSILSSSTNIKDDSKVNAKQIESIMSKCRDELPSIHCDTSEVYFEALESVSEMLNNQYAMEAAMKNARKKYDQTNTDKKEYQNFFNNMVPDGTKSYDSVKPSNFDISGTYIKYIDPKNIIPFKLFDQKIGYYLIHPQPKKNKNSAGEVTGINSIGNTLFSAVNIGEEKKHDAIERIANSIAEGIMSNFNSKFVSKNAEFKKMIADCVIAHGLTDQDYNIQFIPADDIVEFTVNENEEGFGESVLTDSLFPAKLLLSMIVCRMLNYINKTGNKTIAHIYKGPIGTFTSNQVNRVIRDLQEQNVTFNDLLSPNLVFNKFNRDGNISLPTTKNGTKLVEFETQEGQQIDMSPEYEKELENMAILGTGVPTVIMEYAGSADFAKQLVSANIKFAGRVSSLQADLEEATTLLYKKICQNSNLSDEQKIICMQNLEIKLPRPRVLTNSNNGDYIQTLVSTAEAIADVVIGRDSASNPDILKNGTVIKEKLMYDITKKSSPFIDWEDIDESMKRIMLEYAGEEKQEEENPGGGF